MSNRLKKVLMAAGGLVLLFVVLVLTIPMFVDVNRYRGLIQDKAREALGREVRLGEMSLSLFPRVAVRVDDVTVAGLPDEGGDLMTARRLRVGVRLFPLLSKRLEVTTLVLEAPRLTLVRGADGHWNVERLIAARETPDEAPVVGETVNGPPSFSVGRFELTEGFLEIRDESVEGRPLAATLTDLNLSLTDVRPDGPIGFDLSTSWEQVPKARIRFSGQAGPLFRAEGEPLEIIADTEVTHVDVNQLLALIEDIYRVPPELIGGDDVSLAAGIVMSTGVVTRLAVSKATVEGLELSLRQAADGSWNLPATPVQEPGVERPAAAAAGGSSELTLRDIELRDVKLAVRGEPIPGRAIDVTVEDLDARLDRLPTDGPAEVTISGLVDGTGELSIRGRLGPVGESGGVPLELEIAMDSLPPGLTGLFAAEGFRLDTDSGRGSFGLALSGNLPDSVTAVGNLELQGYRAAWTAPDGTDRDLAIDVGADYDVTVIASGERIEIDRLGLELSGNRVEVKGSVEGSDSGGHVDLELLPTEIAADDLAGLLGMVMGGLPVSFASSQPISLAGKASGPYGPGRRPRIDGRVELRDFTFMHSSLTQPLTAVGARVTLGGETIRVDGLTGVAGSSDFKGSVLVEGFEAPEVEFDLTSDRADFGELFSFLRGEEPGAQENAPASSTAESVDPLDGLRMAGRLRIGRGRFDTLQFEDLDARMTWIDEVMRLDPVTLSLYGGAFRGDVVGNLSGAQPAFDIRGDALSIDIEKFLAENLGSPGLLFGSFSGSVATSTVGADYESIIRELRGSGTVQVEQGRIAGLDLLQTLSRVSGMFGEDTLRSLGSRLADEGTAFRAMSGGVQFDGGKMRFDSLLLDSPDFALSGVGAVDLLAASLDGDFELSLSPEISASMRAEDSRAGELFWNGGNRRVEVPFGLEGPFDAPKPSVDWNAVVETAVRGRAEDELRKYLVKQLGGESDQPKSDPVPPKQVAPTGATAQAPATPTSDLQVELTKIGWGGSVLLPDLEMEGAVHGAMIDRAEVRVIDARGAEIQRENLGDVQRFLDSVADRSQSQSIRWKYEVDGKKMVLAKFPVSVRITAFDTAGGATEQVVEVDR